MHDDSVTAVRRWYAEDLRLRTPLHKPAIVEAFAAVPRERFLGPGPWRILPDSRLDEPFVTPDAEPHWLYHDVLVSIDATRALNNGLPSFWAKNFNCLDLAHGERVLQVGAGTGYYSAVLAEIVGPEGLVTAVEHDAELATAARANVAPWTQVKVVQGDGRTHDAGELDAVVVFAGCTHPAPLWLDRLAEDGRLLMPLTGDNLWGFLLRAIRRADTFNASSMGWVGIFPCVGGRDEAAAKRLQRAVGKAHRSSAGVQIQALHRGVPAPEATNVWYSGPGFWLEGTAKLPSRKRA